MGGSRSGNRFRNNAKATTEDYLALDIRRLAQEGALKIGRAGAWQWTRNGELMASIRMWAEEGRLVLTYRHRGDRGHWEEKEYPVRIVRTCCHLGGSRPWFLCAARGCGRRVAILYGGAIFACRHCYQLAYPSTREAGHDRASRRADRLRSRLGWEPGILNGEGPKPKWMRWRTFECLAAEHERWVQQSLKAAAAKFGLPGPDALW